MNNFSENGNGLNGFETKKMDFSPREFLMRYLRFFPWFILSVGTCLILAYAQLRYTTPIYNVAGKLMIKKDNPYGSGRDKFDDIFMMQTANNNLNDEIEIIKSSAIAVRVVKTLGTDISYYNKGNIRSSLIHFRETPIRLEIYQMNDSSGGFSIPVNIVDDNTFTIGESTQRLSFGQTFQLPSGSFKLQRTNIGLNNFASKQFVINRVPPESMARNLAGALKVARVSDAGNVLIMSYETENPRLGKEIVDRYMEAYQQSSLEDKREAAVNTLRFIDDQMDTVKLELGGVERNLQRYRETNKAFNVEQQSQLFFSNISETEKELTVQEVKLKLVDYLIGYISDRSNSFRMVPASLGIDEPSLLQSIEEYNKLQLQRETSLKSIPSGNPVIQDFETAIEKLRGDMLENLRSVRKAYQVAIADLSSKNQRADAEIRTLPGKEKQLLDITRQQRILQELYSYLLQKRLETAISSASTLSNSRIVEPSIFSNVPVRPNRRSLYITAIFIGLLIPVAVISAKEYLNDRIRSRGDVERGTDAPVIGEVGHSEEPGTLIATRNSRKFISEQFRIIRNNLQYVVPKVDQPVIMVTSTFSGEGKSFISTNLGAVMALSGRRTVILEFDIRKPKIMKGLGLKENKGITNYIVSNIAIKDIIFPVKEIEGLYVMPCGPVPPNPAEMLLDPRVQQLFDELKTHFDTIIVDTAPAGLVSDGITLGKYADAAVYIVRYNYTLKKQLKMVDELYKEKKLPRMSLVINDIEMGVGYGGYYGYSSYGYGYGYEYGYGSDYFEDGKKNKRNARVMRRLLRTIGFR
jgi:tyrosine-protein kinase Etk/Wzc